MFSRFFTACLLAVLTIALTACSGTNNTGPVIDGEVEAGGPWKPYEGDWKAQPRDLPQAPGTATAPTLYPQQSKAPGQASTPAAQAGADLPTYGIPALQRPTPPMKQTPTVEQEIHRIFPDPAPAPTDAGYITVAP